VAAGQTKLTQLTQYKNKEGKSTRETNSPDRLPLHPD